MRDPSDSPVVVITGASTGLGHALARRLVAKGLRVIGISRQPDGRDTQITEDLGNLFTGFAGDVADAAQMRRIAAEVEARIGPVAILINNAATYERGDFLCTPAEEICRHIEVNLCGQINAASAFLPAMVDRGHGRIVNITSFAGGDPLPGSLGYSVSKAGTRSFSKALAVELAGRLPGIVVTEWAPDMMATHIGRPDGVDPDRVAQLGVALALNADPALHGATFLQDQQILPRRSLRRRVKDLLLLKRPVRPLRLIPDQTQPGGTR